MNVVLGPPHTNTLPGAPTGSRDITSPDQAGATPEEFSRLSQEVQRYIVRNMVQMSATTLPFIQAARGYVKGCVLLRQL